MAFEPYEPEPVTETYESTSGGVGGQIFLWIAWCLAAAFWAFVATTAVHIIQAGGNPAIARTDGEADVGGLSWFLMDVIGGVVVLGAAIAYGAWRWSTRDRRNDPMTERATHAEYDAIEAAGGDDDDMLHRAGKIAREHRESYAPTLPPGSHSSV